MWIWIAALCQGLAVLGWALLVLRYQYGAAFLQSRDEASLDAVFLAAIAGGAIARAIHRRSHAEARALVLRLALSTSTIIVTIILLEYAARFHFRQVRSSANPGDFFAHRIAIQAPIRVNRLGFRDREIPPKTAGKYRIAIIGDSFTWGQGIEENERFSNLLQQFLGPRYEVFNFGIPAHNMPEHLEVLSQVLPVSPDFVLLQLYINDFETQDMERPRSYRLLPESLDRSLARSSVLYDLMQIAWWQLQQEAGLSESYGHYMDRNLRDPESPNARKAFGQLKEFFERARAAGVGVGAVFFPETKVIGPKGAPYPFAYLDDDVARTCAAAQVQCLDLLPLFSRFRDQRTGWVSPFDAHPNAMANRQAAYAILQAYGAAWH
jgi:hypothetical protein